MIELSDVTVRFGDHLVLNRLDATIPLTGTTWISGTSGSGKTTLLRVLMGLQRPDSGTVTGLAGRRCAAVFQEDRLLPWLTARENVALVSDAATAKCCLDALGLGDALDQKPAALSGGMKRRVAIARAMAFGGDLLLLDEPFTGLDEAARRICVDALLQEQVPIVLVTHGADEAEQMRCAAQIKLSSDSFEPAES